MESSKGIARARILECAEGLIRQYGADAVTVDAVAKTADSAKGLVHYHFKTKQGLLGAVAERIAAARRARWQSAFEAPTADEAISRTWSLLAEESDTGTFKAWYSLIYADDRLPDGLARRIRQEFGEGLRAALTRLLRAKLGLAATVPEEELGCLLEAVVGGTGMLLACGAEVHRLEGAYAAAWLGILSLTRPVT